MAMMRVTVSAPVRYAKWPAQPTRTVGTLLNPGDVLELPEREFRDYRFVATTTQQEANISATTVERVS